MTHGEPGLAEELRTQSIPVVLAFQQRRSQLMWEHIQLLAQAVWALDEACSLIRRTWSPRRMPLAAPMFRDDDAAWARLRERPLRQLLRQRSQPAVVALHHALMAEVRHTDNDPRLHLDGAVTVDPLFTTLAEDWQTHVLRSLVAHDATLAMAEGLTWHVAAWASQRQVYSLFFEYLLAHWTPDALDGFDGGSPQEWVIARTRAWVTGAPALVLEREARLAQLHAQLTEERATLMQAAVQARGPIDETALVPFTQMFHQGRYHFRPGVIRVGMTLTRRAPARVSEGGLDQADDVPA